MTWKVFFTRKAFKQLGRMPAYVRDLAEEAISGLEKEGIHPQYWNTLKTGEREYRLRLNYRYRMRYRRLDGQSLEIEIFYIGHRREAYK